MAGSLLPEPKQQFLNDIGVPLFGGQVFTYAAGTLTPKATYQDQDLTIANTNPVTANARGEVVMYGSGNYRIILKDLFGSTIYDQDNINVNDLTAANGSEGIGNGGESVAQSFNALQLPDYGALRAYVGPRKSVYVTGYFPSSSPSGIAGGFVPDPSDTSSADNGATIIVSSNGMRWKRQYSGGADIRWWGAKFDSTTDDTAAVQACVAYCVPHQIEIILPVGFSKITAPITFDVTYRGLNMTGQGWQLTKFIYPTLASGQSCFLLDGYPGALNGAIIRGIGFNGNSTTNAFSLRGVNGQLIERCQFGANAFACVMANTYAGQFTEFNVLRDCDYLLECQSAIWYLQTGLGDASFHGSGIEGGTINNNGINSVLVLSSAAYPYNSPFSPTIFVHANVTIISYPVSAGIYRPNFYGTMKLEVQAGRALICDAPAANAIAYVGKVLSQSSNVEFGSFFMCDGVFSAASGSRQTIGGRISRTQALTTGANTLPDIPYNIMEGCVFIALRVVGPNYEYRMVLSCWGSGVGGTVVVVATPGVFNVAGYGPPVVTLNGTNQIVITNAGYPATGISCRVDIQQIGQSPFSTFVP